ncbi:hypothetical protein EEI45_03815 [Erysipelothrix piscisicarius]|uniref:TIGR04141 family sporadically distributed protein n=1 Tax=Erysipelothrix piscisicarius TaxID=2485784 RepID=A0A3S8RME2_9FIRM|nr:DUF6119 family protein [Erysipelothrix piscisicarius]AZK44009.1 hypothetical protein EEI45_03815 [Erysipelothrix piscisicarius]
METFFSIYKLDIEFIWKEIIGNKLERVNLNTLCESVIRIVKSKALSDTYNNDNVIEDENGSDYLLLYTKKSTPSRLEAVESNFPEIELNRRNLVNKSTSFLMLSIIGDSVYATTGGYASSYVKYFIIRNFGLNLLTKLFEGTDSVIQELTEKHMVGGRQSFSAINREYTDFENEKDYSTIFRKIGARASFSLSKRLDLLDSDSNEDSYKQYNIISTDALNIRKRMTVSEYKKVLNIIDEIYEPESKFALSYFVSLSNFGVSATKALDYMCNKILDNPEDIEDIQIVGDNHFDYLGAEKWAVFNDDNLVDEKNDSAFTFKEIFDLFKDRYTREELSLNAIKTFMKKWTISAYGNEQKIVLDKERILDLIDFNFTHIFDLDGEKYGVDKALNRELTVYLNSGSWYVLDINYTRFIDESFTELNNKYREEAEKLYLKFDLNRICSNESEYNASFLNGNAVENVICADQIYLSNIEICDLLIFDDDETYLVCNKKEPSGSGSRDLLNQIHSSVKMIQNQPKRLREYYNQLITKGRLSQDYITEDDFCRKISQGVFVSAYVCRELTTDNESMYAKLLSVQTSNLLFKEGKKLIVTSPIRYI